MQIASILSDLTSLRVCDHNAALALVSTRAPASDSITPNAIQPFKSKGDHKTKNDPDMERAMDLIELHQGVKMAHVRGQDQALTQARKEVDAVLAELERLGGKQKSAGR
ncbi:MAG: hypothetical protein LQ337_001626 [Flavoplaca oasis]|nr:MAG: hypothetical protein LQ337_001626 [Flavoplaca oasis]